MKPVVIILTCVLCLFASGAKAHVVFRTDSIGVTNIGGKLFIQHRIEKGESLSAIAKRYSVSVSDIQKSNKLLSSSIKAGDVLLIPKGDAPKASSSRPNQTSLQRVVHTVTKGESLYGIAKKYGTSVEQIRNLNKMQSDALSIGQQLVVKDADASKAEQKTVVQPEPKVEPKVAPKPVAVAPPDPHPAADSRPGNTAITTRSSEHKTGSLIDMMSDMSPSQQDSAIKDNVFPEVEVLTSERVAALPPNAKKTPYQDPYSSRKYLQIEEEGTAGFISDYSTDQTKFYAFHKYLPVGSYLRVDYPAKNQSILVEVISNLDPKSEHVVMLSAKCGHYLSLWKEGEKVRLRYVVPE